MPSNISSGIPRPTSNVHAQQRHSDTMPSNDLIIPWSTSMSCQATVASSHGRRRCHAQHGSNSINDIHAGACVRVCVRACACVHVRVHRSPLVDRCSRVEREGIPMWREHERVACRLSYQDDDVTVFRMFSHHKHLSTGGCLYSPMCCLHEHTRHSYPCASPESTLC